MNKTLWKNLYHSYRYFRRYAGNQQALATIKFINLKDGMLLEGLLKGGISHARDNGILQSAG